MVLLSCMSANHLWIDGGYWKKERENWAVCESPFQKAIKIIGQILILSDFFELEQPPWFQWTYTDFHLLHIHSLLYKKFLLLIWISVF